MPERKTELFAVRLEKSAMRPATPKIPAHPHGGQMTVYRSWRAPHRAMCPEPGPRDLFLVILINGKRVSIQHAEEYERWRVAAERLAAQEGVNVKVLPMSGGEMMNFLGIEPEPPQPIANLDPVFREQTVKNCMDVLRERSGAHDREVALELLGHLGVLQ